jgi:LacI family transcriptional regulator
LEQARKDGYHLLVKPVNLASANVAEDITNLLVQSNLDGMILPPSLCDDPAILQALVSSGKPFARMSPSISTDIGLPVEISDYEAAKQMTMKLIQLGHTSIGFVTGRQGTETTRRWLDGFLSAMKDANLTVPDNFILEGTYEYRSGLDAGESLLKLAQRPTAIFASHDEMAAGLIAAAHKSGLSVPEELSTAGFDDSVIATVVWPQLTTVRQPIKEMAAAAVDMVTKQCRGQTKDEATARKLPIDLIMRESTALKS